VLYIIITDDSPIECPRNELFRIGDDWWIAQDDLEKIAGAMNGAQMLGVAKAHKFS